MDSNSTLKTWLIAIGAAILIAWWISAATSYQRVSKPCEAERTLVNATWSIFFRAAQERIPREKLRGIIEPDELLDLAKDYAEYEYIAARDAQRAYEECLMRLAGR
ncbi:MAG TPA: hypothetical protein VF161_07045 [Steroidobacteraceae bacterium]